MTNATAALADSPTLNMVQCQIAPNGVTNEDVLGTFLALDRAAYLPFEARARAYADENVCDARGQLLMVRPLTAALIAQYLAGQYGRGQVAVIGDTTGYCVEIFSALGFAAIAVHNEEALEAGKQWQAIVIHGAAASLPTFLYGYLEEDGAVLALLQPTPDALGDLAAVDKHGVRQLIAQASAPYAEGFAPLAGFTL